MAWLAFADALLYLLALKEMKANVYGKSFHTDTTVVHSSNHFPSKWKIRQLFCSSYRFRAKDSE